MHSPLHTFSWCLSHVHCQQLHSHMHLLHGSPTYECQEVLITFAHVCASYFSPTYACGGWGHLTLSLSPHAFGMVQTRGQIVSPCETGMGLGAGARGRDLGINKGDRGGSSPPRDPLGQKEGRVKEAPT